MVQRSEHCLGHELGEIVVSVKMPITRNGTERPREPSLKYDPLYTRGLIPKGRHCLVGSLTGVVSSESVTEDSKGTLMTIGNRQ